MNQAKGMILGIALELKAEDPVAIALVSNYRKKFKANINAPNLIKVPDEKEIQKAKDNLKLQ